VISRIADRAVERSVIGKMFTWYSTGTNTWLEGLPVKRLPRPLRKVNRSAIWS
jgi:hypothetical protein